jgi:hypothetical protein
LIVIVTLTLAVGATAAVGSLLNALVFRTLAVPSPGQLVVLSAFEPRASVEGYFYADTVNAYRASQRSFAQMSLYAGGGIARVERVPSVRRDRNRLAELLRHGRRGNVGGTVLQRPDDAVAGLSEAPADASSVMPRIGEVIKVDGPGDGDRRRDGRFAGLQPTGLRHHRALRGDAMAGGDPSKPFRS